MLRPEMAARVSKQAKNYDKHQWELYKYPLIKWKSHPVAIAQGGTAQLDTTFNSQTDMFGRGLLKYRLRLSEPHVNSVAVQLLDANGFKVIEFNVAPEQFHLVPGTSLIEAADEYSCRQGAYKRARDYVVKQAASL